MFILLLISLFNFTLTTFKTPIVLNDIEGRHITFSSLKGKWIFINYWASWCAPCLNEIKTINQFYKTHDNSKFIFFAVNYEGLAKSTQINLIQKHHIHYPSLATDPAASLKLGDITGVPVTFVYNPQGKLEDTVYGELTIERLNAYVIKQQA